MTEIIRDSNEDRNEILEEDPEEYEYFYEDDDEEFSDGETEDIAETEYCTCDEDDQRNATENNSSEGGTISTPVKSVDLEESTEFDLPADQIAENGDKQTNTTTNGPDSAIQSAMVDDSAKKDAASTEPVDPPVESVHAPVEFIDEPTPELPEEVALSSNGAEIQYDLTETKDEPLVLCEEVEVAYVHIDETKGEPAFTSSSSVEEKASSVLDDGAGVATGGEDLNENNNSALGNDAQASNPDVESEDFTPPEEEEDVGQGEVVDDSHQIKEKDMKMEEKDEENSNQSAEEKSDEPVNEPVNTPADEPVNKQTNNDEDDDDDEDEEDLVDPWAELVDKCGRTKCKRLGKILDDCNERLEEGDLLFRGETCTEELFNFIECKAECASKLNFMRKLV